MLAPAERRVRLQAQEVCEGGDLKIVIGRASRGTGKRDYSYIDAHRWSTQVGFKGAETFACLPRCAGCTMSFLCQVKGKLLASR